MQKLKLTAAMHGMKMGDVSEVSGEDKNDINRKAGRDMRNFFK